jgi:DNA topoisomerase-2
MRKKKIEEIYKSMDPIEHIILRPGMYIGSIKNEPKQMFLYSRDESKMILRDIEYTPGLLKLLDEIISNSCDEYRRKTNLGLTELTVILDKSGKVIIKDNGGIPIVKHKEAKVYIPEFIFGQLRTSSNYDDTENRDVIGTNGLGSKICNIFSTYFSIYTADGKNSFFRSWENNMRKINDDLKIKKCKEHFTESKFNIDFDKFECGNEFSDDFISIIEKRCIDAAAANIGLTVYFKYTDNKKTIIEDEWNFKSFEEYLELYTDYVDLSEMIKFKDDIMNVWIFPDNGINVAFVNGAICSKGSHIKAVRNEINTYLSNYFSNKEKIEITNKNIDNKYSLFGIFKINNPTYDSQTKDQLTNQLDKFSSDINYKFKIPDNILKQISKSEIKDIILDWYKQKSEVEDQKILRKLNKQAKTKIKNNEKFINANSKTNKNKELWIYEGNSATSGFRYARDPQTQAAYLLRGVILNTTNLSPTKIMENRELSDIITILGLQWGDHDIKKLNFSKIIIATDADFDGSHICGLLLSFFNLWPELYENNMICRSITPIIIATKGNDVQKFYKMDDFKKEEKNLKGYKIKYAKGLGSLSNDEYKDMLRNPVLHYYKKDELADNNLRLWFNKNIAKERKENMKALV